MKILVSWLREFVDVAVGIERLADTLGEIGFEVASVEPAPADVGATDLPDAIIDLEIYANRPDCMGIVGVAREVAAALGQPFRGVPGETDGQRSSNGADRALPVDIDALDLCPRYVAAVAEVTIGPSPAWLAARLLAAGVRPINNVVDVTNYVMLEMGQPMHAFDMDRLTGPALRIRRAKGGETLKTLDGELRTLTADMLVIADAEKPQAIGGVMGGAASEVHDGTRRVVFESAYFTPVSVRKTSKRLGLKTEASARFERGADIDVPARTMRRALSLLERIEAGRRVGDIIDVYVTRKEPRRLTLKASRLSSLLGHPIDRAVVTSTLERLGFEVSEGAAQDDAEWAVGVPTWRIDVSRDVDLIEEVARHYGYDRIPARFPPLEQPPPPPEPRLHAERLARHVLGAAGFSEAVTWAFVERDAAVSVGDEARLVPLANPLSEKLAVLRPSMLTGLLESVGHNRRRERRDVQLYEIGSRFDSGTGETRAVAWAWTGAATPQHWSGQARQVDFFDVKGVVERLAAAFAVPIQVQPADVPHLVPGRSAVVRIGGEAEPLGYLGQLAPQVAASRDLPSTDPIYVAELNLDRLTSLMEPERSTRVEPLPRFPSIVRDVSIQIDEALPAADVRGTIRAAAPGTLAAVREFDRYQGPGIPPGSVSLSLRLTFRSSERTLTDAEVDGAMAAIVAALEKEHRALRR